MPPVGCTECSSIYCKTSRSHYTGTGIPTLASRVPSIFGLILKVYYYFFFLYVVRSAAETKLHLFLSILSLFTVLSCLQPRPQSNGRFCLGSSRLNQLCNTRPCLLNAMDYRAQQCAEYNSKTFRGWYYKWKPYTKVDGKRGNRFKTQQVLC